MTHLNEREKVFGYADGERFKGLGAKEVFNQVHRENYWNHTGREESVSGPGSSLSQTATIRDEIPQLLQELGIASVLDIPCGDFNWLKGILPVGIRYIGADIVAELAKENNRRYGSENQEFRVLNLLEDGLPGCDLVLCRDCLVHFSFGDVFRALGNVVKSGARYLLTTTFSEQHANKEIVTGGWRPLNLELEPFHLPTPLRLINEKCTEAGGLFSDKSLGLWKISSLPAFI